MLTLHTTVLKLHALNKMYARCFETKPIAFRFDTGTLILMPANARFHQECRNQTKGASNACSFFLISDERKTKKPYAVPVQYWLVYVVNAR